MSFSKRTEENLSSLHASVEAQFRQFVTEAQAAVQSDGVTIEVISGYRSFKTQAGLFARGRTLPGPKVTNAAPGQSWHNYGLAVDLGLFRGGAYLDETQPAFADRVYRKIAAVARRFGIEWAGNWKSFQETPHFQNTLGMTIAQARAKLDAAKGVMDNAKF